MFMYTLPSILHFDEKSGKKGVSRIDHFCPGINKLYMGSSVQIKFRKIILQYDHPHPSSFILSARSFSSRVDNTN